MGKLLARGWGLAHVGGSRDNAGYPVLGQKAPVAQDASPQHHPCSSLVRLTWQRRKGANEPKPAGQNSSFPHGETFLGSSFPTHLPFRGGKGSSPSPRGLLWGFSGHRHDGVRTHDGATGSWGQAAAGSLVLATPMQGSAGLCVTRGSVRLRGNLALEKGSLHRNPKRFPAAASSVLQGSHAAPAARPLPRRKRLCSAPAAAATAPGEPTGPAGTGGQLWGCRGWHGVAPIPWWPRTLRASSSLPGGTAPCTARLGSHGAPRCGLVLINSYN